MFFTKINKLGLFYILAIILLSLSFETFAVDTDRDGIDDSLESFIKMPIAGSPLTLAQTITGLNSSARHGAVEMADFNKPVILNFNNADSLVSLSHLNV